MNGAWAVAAMHLNTYIYIYMYIYIYIYAYTLLLLYGTMDLKYNLSRSAVLGGPSMYQIAILQYDFTFNLHQRRPV